MYKGGNVLNLISHSDSFVQVPLTQSYQSKPTTSEYSTHMHIIGTDTTTRLNKPNPTNIHPATDLGSNNNTSNKTTSPNIGIEPSFVRNRSDILLMNEANTTIGNILVDSTSTRNNDFVLSSKQNNPYTTSQIL